MAALKLATASALVRPCPFAPGTSGQYAMNQSSSCSMIAVNPFRTPSGYPKRATLAAIAAPC